MMAAASGKESLEMRVSEISPALILRRSGWIWVPAFAGMSGEKGGLSAGDD
jgi:hypothetical protein